MDQESFNPTLLNMGLHPKQKQAINTAANEVLFGGAAGGGKSHLMRVLSIYFCLNIPGLQTYLFRRIFPDLIKNHMEGPKGYRALLAPLVSTGQAKILEDEIRFFNGSKIFLCHCAEEKDMYKYYGYEFHLLLMDELTTFTENIYRFLRSRVRMTGINIPPAFRNLFPRIFSSSNPGNIGHHWVKSSFIDDHPPYEIHKAADVEGGMLRQFIPSRLEDNPSIDEDDPTYRAKLKGLGSPQLVKALEEGDWNVIAGAFFPEFSHSHILKPFTIPSHYTLFRSFDWGTYYPFSVGWFAVTDEYGRFPRGSIIQYCEWYGSSKINRGLNLPSVEVARGIRKLETKDEKILYSVADPSIFQHKDGPSTAQRMAKYVQFQRGSNKRIPGWDAIRERLRGVTNPDGTQSPTLYFFDTCVHSIRTLPLLQHSNSKPEDADTDGEDHAPDMVRYACMSRIFVREKLEDPTPPKTIRDVTLDELWTTQQSSQRNQAPW